MTLAAALEAYAVATGMTHNLVWLPRSPASAMVLLAIIGCLVIAARPITMSALDGPRDNPSHGSPRRVRLIKAIGLSLCVILALYSVGRAIVELVTLDPSPPESYRRSWGGPNYLGVLAVHCLPGVAGAAYLIALWRSCRRQD